MKPEYPIEWVPATPDYILASIQEEWRQIALPDEDKEDELPTLTTTIRQWREVMDLVEWGPLGRGLNRAWGTRFSRREWREVLESARERTLRGVCELLASQARRPSVPPARLLGHHCGAAGVFLAVRSMLVQAGAPPKLRPSTALQPFLRKWPKVFQEQIARLSPGGLPYMFGYRFWATLTALTSLAGVLLLVIGSVFNVSEIVIGGVILFAAGWMGGLFCRGPLTLENVHTFRDLSELIVKKQQRYGFGPPENSTR